MPPTLAAFAEKFAPVGFRETSFLPSYGLAEHVLAATFRAARPRVRGPSDLGRRSDRAARRDARDERRRRSITLVSCGSALPGHRIRIVDEHGASAAGAAGWRDPAGRAIGHAGLL